MTEQGDKAAERAASNTDDIKSRLGRVPLWVWLVLVLVVGGKPLDVALQVAGVDFDALGGGATATQRHADAESAEAADVERMTRTQVEGEAMRRDVEAIRADLDRIRQQIQMFGDVLLQMQIELVEIKESRYTDAEAESDRRDRRAEQRTAREERRTNAGQIVDVWDALARMQRIVEELRDDVAALLRALPPRGDQ